MTRPAVAPPTRAASAARGPAVKTPGIRLRARMMRPAIALPLLGALLAAFTLGGLAVHPAGAAGLSPAWRADRFVALEMGAVATWFAAVAVVVRAGPAATPRRFVVLVLGVALGLRAALLVEPPFLSSDIYRYVWDGRVQRAGIDPYLHVPADPSLAALRDAAIFPRINRAGYAPTIYPPAAEAVFGLLGTAFPGGGVRLFKLAMVGFELAGIACAMRLLALCGLPAARVLIYAWNPVALWSFSLDGHVDAIAVGLVGAALLARARRRDGLAGAALAGAFLVKFLPAAIAPALLRGARPRRLVAVAVATVLAGYALYAPAGRRVLGFLPGYGGEEGLSNGTGLWIPAGLDRLGVPPRAALVAYAALVAGALGLAAWRAWTGPVFRRDGADPADIRLLCRDAAILSALVIAALSPHYPWYFAQMALPCVVAPIPAVLWLASASALLSLDPFHERFFWQGLVYAPALLLAFRGRSRRPA